MTKVARTESARDPMNAETMIPTAPAMSAAPMERHQGSVPSPSNPWKMARKRMSIALSSPTQSRNTETMTASPPARSSGPRADPPMISTLGPSPHGEGPDGRFDPLARPRVSWAVVAR